ncbi:hypothetical protein BKD30_14210 [Tersicoccus phoenicis]|uniref:DUF1877 domain-containing protein n=1 Tax=Tersicoccus phoenicis TaxID=554083 RepID=A0A1R1L660_9MICC|nr:DUF1877 family protein [Tersicoccus phoenicis]OMH23027.1 hypothetical protein BKD30_14210 [Tersicoccus phoenicis]
MGIRYYAYPLPPELVTAARLDPSAYLSSDPLADAWDLDGQSRPRMLYLDKCWGLLQQLTCADPRAPRPSYLLVEGRVTHTHDGWIPWTRVLDADEVGRIADDLALINPDDLDDLFARGASHFRDDDRDYLESYLAQAKEFTADLRARGQGLVYMIG